MRAASTAWMVSGTGVSAARPSCSRTAWANSSRNNGFPSALVRIRCTRAAACCAGGSTARTTAALSSRVSRGQGELRGIRFVHPERAIPGAVGGEQQQGRPGELVHQGGQVGFGGGIDPVQIFHHQEQRLLLTAAQVHLAQRGKGALFDDVRRQLGQGLRRGGTSQELAGDTARCLPAAGRPPGGAGSTWVATTSEAAVALRPTLVPQQVADGPIGEEAVIGPAVAFQDRHRPVLEPLPEFGQEPRFADPRLPDKAHHLPLALQSAGQEVV